MAALGNNYFTSVPESTTSKRVECVVYTGPSQGIAPNTIRNQDTISIVITKLVAAIKKHESRIIKLE